MPLRIDTINPDTGCGKVRGVIQIGMRTDRKSAAQHSTVAVRCVNGKNEGIGLKRPNPHRIETLVENSKRREEAASRHRQIGIRDVIDLRVVDMLGDWAAIGPAIRGTRKFAPNPARDSMSQRSPR